MYFLEEIFLALHLEIPQSPPYVSHSSEPGGVILKRDQSTSETTPSRFSATVV